MIKYVTRYLKNLYYADIKLISKEKVTSFFEEITTVNHARLKPLALLLLIADLGLIMMDFTLLRGISPNRWASDRAFILHLIGFLFFVFFCILFFFFYQRFKLISKRILLFLFVYASLIFCQFVSLSTYQLYGQVTPMIISLCTFASFYIVNCMDRLLMLSSVFVSLGIIFPGSMIEPSRKAGFWISIFFLVVISFITSKFSFSNYVKQFTARQIIINNAIEIGRLNTDLEKKVQERTEELTQANAQIELEKLRVSFFTNLSHEIRTPINVILSAQQLLELKLKKALPEMDYVSLERNLLSIKQYSYRLMRLTSNLIDMTRIDSGYYKLNLRNTNIVQVVEEIVYSVATYIDSREITVIFDTQTEERLLAIDIDKIERVMLNLLSNAVKFTPKNGEINVNLFENKENFFISVKDSGIGIPAHMVDDIFNRFVQVDKTLSRNREGSGLGLSIAKSIIELHEGTISVKSNINTGSEFIISLPIRTLSTKEPVTHYSFRGQENLDLVRIEFSDIEV